MDGDRNSSQVGVEVLEKRERGSGEALEIYPERKSQRLFFLAKVPTRIPNGPKEPFQNFLTQLSAVLKHVPNGLG